jgi:DNA helicase-2/ATP-dependent DNA helicase PcrA
VDNEDDMEEERRLMYVAITRAKERLYMTRSRSRYLYGKREPTMRSRFLKELSSEIELPKEARPRPLGYDGYDDPESYGNSAYGGGRYASNDDYGRKNTFGGGYSSGYGRRDSSREDSAPSRSTWGGSSYGSSSYGGSSYGSSSYGSSSYGGTSGYGAKSAQNKNGGFTYGGISRLGDKKPTSGGKDLSVFRIGVRVKHPKFGEGTIVNVRGADSNMIVDIAFENLGIKQLSASLAPLTVI